MTPADMIAKIDALHREGKFFGLTIWPTSDGLQCNLATTSKNNWRIRRADTPSEGLALVLAMDFLDDERPRTSSELLGEGEMLAPPAVDEPPLPDEAHEEEPEWVQEAAAEHAAAKADEAGIFD